MLRPRTYASMFTVIFKRVTSEMHGFLLSTLTQAELAAVGTQQTTTCRMLVDITIQVPRAFDSD